MGVITSYLGETDSKRVVRYHMATHVSQMLKNPSLSKGRILALGGDIAGDYGWLRYIAKVDPSRVTVVEKNPDYWGALTWVRRTWPGVDTFTGRIEDAIRGDSTPISLLVADCTGRLTNGGESIPILKAAAPKLGDDAVVTLTHYRGRDQPVEKPLGNSMILPRLPGESHRSLIKRRHERRSVLYAGAVRTILGRPDCELTKVMSYGAKREDSIRHSPMGIMVFKDGKHMPKSKSQREVIKESDHVGSKNAADRLRNVVIALIYKGFDTHTIAEVLNLSESSVRAWRAHETRGTYKIPTRR